ncbi:MAG: hypothetical protein ABSE66_09900 [Thermoplasmata archaeon]|jgi:hypothetical protein
MSAADHDGSVCSECGGLLDVSTSEAPFGERRPSVIRRTKCEECGRRTEEYL